MPSAAPALHRPARWLLVAAAAALCTTRADAFGEAPKYLIASAPRRSLVAYMKLPATGAPAVAREPMKVLVTAGLRFPQGIAVDQYRKRLFVADPNLGKLIGYPLYHSGDDIYVGEVFTVAHGVEVRSVAVDGLGNVFFTEEPRQLVMRVTARMIEEGKTTPEIVYDSSTYSAVSAPGGIALDNYFVYWLNKASGEQVGTVVRGLQEPPVGENHTNKGVVSLSANSMKCYGLCVALGNIFYTDEAYNLYGIPRAATARHDPVTISSTLREPRGCAYDGDSTVYVADKDQHAIFQFASNMQKLSPNRMMTKAADLEGAFGVAVYTRVIG